MLLDGLAALITPRVYPLDPHGPAAGLVHPRWRVRENLALELGGQMRLTSHVLRTWADDHQIPDLNLAELDYRLTQALDAIYSDPFPRERLYLKGGTAVRGNI